jgi:soluble lytic murein transglycosylase
MHGMAPARAEVYRGWSDDGTPVFSDRPQDDFVLYLVNDDPPVAAPARRQTAGALTAGKRRHAAMIATVAAEYRLAPELLHAVVQVESGYNAAAISSKGAIGLMQLMPGTARRLGVADSLDPLDNLRGGARYLRELLDRFGELPLALAAYNAGEAAVLRYARRIPPYAETVAYVRAVQRRYELLTRDL